MAKLAGIRWDDETRRLIGNEAGASRVSPTRKWLRTMIDDEGMVDAFRYFYPLAQGRYTCWHQFTNRRYANEGARIDYTLVDRSLVTHVLRGDVESLRVCSDRDDSNSEAAALAVATANNGFQPVSFQGGGIAEASQSTLDSQFGTPHTGMIYTPPSFSDHIAVSLLLSDDCRSPDLVLNESDAATRKAQPHKTQKSIKSFFGSASSKTTNTEPSTLSAKGTGQQNAQKRKGIQHFFAPKSTGVGILHQTKRPNISTLTAKKKRNILSHFGPKK